MDKALIMGKLKAGAPLFATIPSVSHVRICGTESEYGIKNNGERIEAAFHRLPGVLFNGGEVYKDMEHVEYCSPEASNAVSAVASYEAGKEYCMGERFSSKLYCNNNDWQGNTYGAHENYFTCAPRDSWFSLIPFLVARTVMTGSGWFTSEPFFEISQRAGKMESPFGASTTSHRSILNTRNESLAMVPGWDRLHLICGDANMCEMATFLKIAFTSLVVEMLELRALPRIAYNIDQAVRDLALLSRKTGDWYLNGLEGRSRGVVDLLDLYARRARELFARRDEVTDTALVVIEDTLEHLGKDPMKLFGRLDWVTKLTLLNTFNGCCDESSTDWLMSQDLAYHDLDPSEGLYFHVRDAGGIDGLGVIERLISNELISRAVREPWPDTRSYARGKAVLFLKGTGMVVCGRVWSKLIVMEKGTACVEFENGCAVSHSLLEVDIGDPRLPYHDQLEEFKRRFNFVFR